MAQCARGHGVGVEGCIPQRHVPGGLLALCMREKDVGPQEVLGGWRDAEATTESRADRSRRDDRGGGGGATRQPTCLREMERVPTEAGTRGSRMSLWPSRPCRGDRGPSVVAGVGREKTSSTPMLSPPPPPPIGRHLLYPSAPDRGTSDGWRSVALYLPKSNAMRTKWGHTKRRDGLFFYSHFIVRIGT